MAQDSYGPSSYGPRYKDSITIVELMHLAARLAGASALSAAEAAKYRGRALAVWDWIFGFDGGRGLLTDGIMSTGAQPAWCCSPTQASAVVVGRRGQVCAKRVASVACPTTTGSF